MGRKVVRVSTICATALAAKLPRLRKRESKLFRHKGFPLRREVSKIMEIALKGGYPFMGAGFILRPFFMREFFWWESKFCTIVEIGRCAKAFAELKLFA